MGLPLTEYDKELGKRIEELAEKERFTQRQMASLMGVSVQRYKRFIYGELKVPTECTKILLETFPVDKDYMLFGNRSDTVKLAESIVGGSYRSKADLCMELARIFRHLDSMEKIDYIVNDNLIVEATKPIKKTKK